MEVIAPRRFIAEAPPLDAGEAWEPARATLLDRALRQAGIARADYEVALRAAAANGSDAGEELIARGVAEPEGLARAVAAALDVPFAVPGARDRPVGEPAARHMKTCRGDLSARLFIAPRLETLDETRRWIALHGTGRVLVTTLEALRSHRAAQSVETRLRRARYALAAERPDLSARWVLSPWQAFAMGIAACAAALASVLYGTLLRDALHLAVGVFFAANVLFRLAVLLDLPRERARRRAAREALDASLSLPVGPLPVYTVLVALYREEAMVGALVASLQGLNWPRSRIDVKLVCEGDDAPTIAAAERAIAGRRGFEIVRVPPSVPRTKPKALNHALPLARGEFVVLYDAEDRPDPDQLLEAWLAFRDGGPDLACVQAPLTIRNHATNWLTAIFALEYAVLFRALHPFLARRALPIPLGGTSNHFRRNVLAALGGWDSHNVAEDADLGIRLARHGFRTGVVAAPTSEIAPTTFRDWRNQRSRWMKGWVQTWLVHMRRPLVTARELGFRRMAAFQLLFFGMVAGALMHTVFLACLALALVDLASHSSLTFGPTWLLALDVFNVVSACIVFAAAAAAVRRDGEARVSMKPLAALWLYWLLVSLAGLRAVGQLFADPHGWEKTPHVEADDA